MKKLLLLTFTVASFSAQAQFWTEKATGFATAQRGINDIDIVDQNVIWAKAYDGSGGNVGTIKEFTRSTDGGETWTAGIMNLGLGTAGLGIGSISAVSDQIAWVTGHPDTGNTGGVWKTINGGTTWSKQLTAAYSAASFTNIVYFFDENNGITMGDPEEGYFEIYTTTNGGTNWTRVAQSNIPAHITTGIGEYGYTGDVDEAGGTLWFGTNFGRLYRSTDMGATWSVSQTPLTDMGLGSYSFSDATKGLLATDTGLLYSTNDAGVTWVAMSPTGTFGDEIEYVPGTTNVISAVFASGETFYSTDDGMTWMVGQTDTPVTELEFYDSTTGFGGGFNDSPTAGGIYKYTGTFLAVAQFNNETMSVSPNPSNGYVQIAGITVKQVTVFDILGKQVYNNTFNGLNVLDLDLTSLNSGVYLMTVTNDGGLTKTVKIVRN